MDADAYPATVLGGNVEAASRPVVGRGTEEARPASAIQVPRGSDVPAAVVVTLATALAAATVAGWLGWKVLGGRVTAATLLIAAVVVAGTAVRYLRPTPVPTSRPATLILMVPAVSVLVAALVGQLRGAPAGLTWFLNGDHPRHVVYVADTWVQGNLTYAVEGYPRGWHSVLAASWSVLGAGLDPASVLVLLQLMAMTSLVLSALLALSMAHLGHALAQRLACGGQASVAVGFVVGCATLLNVFLGTYQALGYENSLLAAVVLAVCCREALVRPGSAVSLVVCGAGAVVIAHAWQLLLPAVAVAGLWCAVSALRRGDRAATALVVAMAGFVVLVGSPAVVAVVQGVGLAHATEAGPDSPVPIGPARGRVGVRRRPRAALQRWSDADPGRRHRASGTGGSDVGRRPRTRALAVLPEQAPLAVLAPLVAMDRHRDGEGHRRAHQASPCRSDSSPWCRLGRGGGVRGVHRAPPVRFPGRHLVDRRRGSGPRGGRDPRGGGRRGRLAPGLADDRRRDPEPARRAEGRPDEDAGPPGGADDRPGVRPSPDCRATGGAVDRVGRGGASADTPASPTSRSRRSPSTTGDAP